MAKKKQPSKKASMKALIKKAKERLPSERSKLQCVGCFAPRNTLTVKSHIEKVWQREQIILEPSKSGVSLPCQVCNEIRYLNLSKFSLDVFMVDYDDYTTFTLLKDDKYNALIGFQKEDKTLVIKKEFLS